MNIAIDKQLMHWFDSEHLTNVESFDAEELEELCAANTQNFIVCLNIKAATGMQLLQKIQGAKKTKYLSHQIDIQQFIKRNQRSFPASKKNLFSQAVGRKTQKVIDATGGWLGDTLMMCSQNYQVQVLERHWLLQGFIAEACHRLSESEWLITNQAPLPELNRIDAIEYLESPELAVDCVYIDPMFPPKVKQSAAVRKSMQVLHELIGQDVDAHRLFMAAYSSNVRRIVVKRPDYAEPLHLGLSDISSTTETLKGKLVRYDVYIR